LRLFAAIATLLRSAAREAPLVIAIEDLHAADEPSLLLLRFLVHEIQDSRLLVVGSYRDADLQPSDGLPSLLAELERERLIESIGLPRFDERDIERFLELAIGRKPPPGLTAVVVRQSDGNPLFVTEIVRLLATEERLA